MGWEVNQIIPYVRAADGFNCRGNGSIRIGPLRIFGGYLVVDQQTDIFRWERGLEDPPGMIYIAGQELRKVIHGQQCRREKDGRLAALQRYGQHGGWIQ